MLPYARVGVVGGIMLGLGRALGETMAVTFVIGNAHRISASILAPGTTISAAIANEFTEAVGDLYTSSLIALGLILFVITFIVLALAKLMLHAHAAAGGEAEPWTSIARRRATQLRRADDLPWRRPRSACSGSIAILWTLLYNGVSGDRPGALHRDDAAAGQRRRPAERDLRQPGDDRSAAR